MTTSPRSVALVGATGGAGTTRTAVETATILARDGRDVAVFDAAFATQGLAQYVHGRIDTDVTRLLTTESIAPSDAFVDLAVDTDGRVAICPAYAAFAELAAAKSTDAAERFGALLRQTADVFDHVLVDTPPVGDNPSVAAVNATERTALVVPASQRGADALPRARDRLADIDATADAVIVNRVVDDHPVESPSVTVPESVVDDVTGAPVCGPGAAGEYPAAVAAVAESCFEMTLDVDLRSPSVTERLLGR